MAQAQLLGRIHAGGLEPRQGLARVLTAQKRPQQAIGHRRQPPQATALGQLHGGAHRRRSGDAPAVEQLIEAQVQEPAQLGGLTLGGELAQLIEPGIKAAALADGPIGELGGQGPVLR